MRKRPTLGPTQGLIVMAGIGVLSLMGIPGFARYEPPVGSLPGVVRGEDGRGVRGCPVALFDGESLRLIELVRSDEQGRFAFAKAPRAFHVFAAPETTTGLVGNWLLARSSARVEGPLELELRRGRLARIQVLGPDGLPAPAVEIRAYDAGPEPRALVRTRTDAQGMARLVVPDICHLAALPDAAGLLPEWRFDESVPEKGGFFELRLTRGVPIQGKTILEDGRPMRGIVVSSWDRRNDRWLWNGYTLSDTWGAFSLIGRGDGTEVRALSPNRPLLPGRRVVRGSEPLEALVLRAGLPLEVRCVDDARAGMRARVWVWSEAANAWSWGSRTDGDGKLRTSVSELHSVVADPEPGSQVRRELWDHVYAAPELVLGP